MNTVSESTERARRAARLADEKKAEDIVVLDVTGVCTFCDAFVVATGSTGLQLRAIADSIIMGLKADDGFKPAVDGERNASWVVLDYGDVVVHLMSQEAREFYRLEDLWGDGKQIDWQDADAAQGATAS
ncbi:MAG: ribosome-associated protein [Candidatus Sumerlaeota bacterium]|nr:ribosome-associated protein [Candidatus Sumerlaeota bacterium]